ncbi:DEAD/DEAH box helicase [Anabaena sphaerica FACHB-251]|uniref:DEAD/DEAH box helicase n=1 Tax=Anabaena sphaerica FACHB-251 TaxID=2692883 RepID=A0A927A0P3_9NOST|nr:DEAD/DEAH box helicase [Anabaena sphaerica]MBD2295177.1 DEAD/DEAH box helicase [Anabaena sphaerica FACHB-251]
MNTPNYSLLLQSLWTPPTTPIPENSPSNHHPPEPTEITEFLAEEILYQQTIPATEPNLKTIPKDLPKQLIKALQSLGITQLYSHQIKALQAIRTGKSFILTSPTASGKTLSTYPGIIEGCINQEHRALAFYGLRALALDQFHKISQLLSTIPQKYRPVLAMMTGDIKSAEREQILASEPHILGVTPELIHFQLKQLWKSPNWANFYQRLRYILIDEAHTLSGSYGANMAWLIRRIKLAVDKYGGDSQKLQFIFLSATCGNPKQLALKVSGLKPTKLNPKPLIWIRKSGASAPPRQVIVTQPSYNLTADTARIIQFLLNQNKSGIAFCNSRRSVRELTELLKSNQVTAFYSGITSERRAEVINQLQSGIIKWIIATEALEAGIDLPELECCVLRGWPGSKMAYQQRSGRAGRSQPGLTVLLPNALNPIDCYVAEHPEMLVSGEAEEVFFNDEYPIFAAKHLMCAAAETGIPTNKIKHYFGAAAFDVAKLLLAQGHLHKGKNGLWAKGYPHKDVNFRGGLSQTTIKLVDAISGEELEEISEDIAHREVHPQAIYKRQNAKGQMLTYQCISLDLNSKRAILKQIADSSIFTVATTVSQTSSLTVLTDPVNLPLLFSSDGIEEKKQEEQEQKIKGKISHSAPLAEVEECQVEVTHELRNKLTAETQRTQRHEGLKEGFRETLQKSCQEYLTLELSFGEVQHITSGFNLMTQIHEQTCLNKRCLNYKEPLPQQLRCPLCRKLTRKAVIVKTLSEEKFKQPFRTQFSAPMVKVTINSSAREYIQQFAKEIRTSLTRSKEPIPSGYQQLWEYSSTFIAIHSFGHQIMRALQLVAKVDPKQVNFTVVKELGDGNNYTGYFYDTSDGGNGAAEAVFKHLPKLAEVAGAIARDCNCNTGCAKCLIQHGCPDGNTALLKQMGLVLLDAVGIAE